MYTSLSVIQVLNSEEELQAFPVEGVFRISFDNKPDLYLLNKHAYIMRHDGEFDDEMPNLGDSFIRAVGDVNVDRYDVVETENTIIENDGTWILELRPLEALIPNASYYAIMSENLAPQHCTVEKVSSYGSSNISLETSIDSSGITATYIIDITTQSVLSTGSHVIGFSILKDGLTFRPSEVFDIKTGSYMLESGLEISFDPNVPFLIGERFRIICTAFTRLEKTLVQALSTFLDSTVIQPSAEIQSTRADEADILKFYEDNGWSRRVPDDIPATATTQDAAYQFIYPNIIIIDTGVDIDLSTLEDAIFNVEVGYAFGNYMLPNMGLSGDEQYEIVYSLSDPQHIKLVVNLSDAVPVGQRFILTQGV